MEAKAAAETTRAAGSVSLVRASPPWAGKGPGGASPPRPLAPEERGMWLCMVVLGQSLSQSHRDQVTHARAIARFGLEGAQAEAQQTHLHIGKLSQQMLPKKQRLTKLEEVAQSATVSVLEARKQLQETEVQLQNAKQRAAMQLGTQAQAQPVVPVEAARAEVSHQQKKQRREVYKGVQCRVGGALILLRKGHSGQGRQVQDLLEKARGPPEISWKCKSWVAWRKTRFSLGGHRAEPLQSAIQDQVEALEEEWKRIWRLRHRGIAVWEGSYQRTYMHGGKVKSCEMEIWQQAPVTEAARKLGIEVGESVSEPLELGAAIAAGRYFAAALLNVALLKLDPMFLVNSLPLQMWARAVVSHYYSLVTDIQMKLAFDCAVEVRPRGCRAARGPAGPVVITMRRLEWDIVAWDARVNADGASMYIALAGPEITRTGALVDSARAQFQFPKSLQGAGATSVSVSSVPSRASQAAAGRCRYEPRWFRGGQEADSWAKKGTKVPVGTRGMHMCSCRSAFEAEAVALDEGLDAFLA
ncbi:unnamed protein product, partial [Prorocentrum cordatum]